MQFPKTLAAVKSAEKNLWAIGDAILAECGEPSENGVRDGSRDKISMAAIALNENGFDYSEITLRMYRDIAYNFPADTRVSAVSFTIHREARYPETLKEIISRLKPGEKLTREKTRDIIDQIEDEKEDVKQIKKETVVAWTGEPNTKMPATQPVTPPTTPAPPPVTSTPLIPAMASISRAVSNMHASLRLAAETQAAIEPYTKNMGADDRDSLLELALSNHAKWLEIANKLRNNKDQRSHLAVVS